MKLFVKIMTIFLFMGISLGAFAGIVNGISEYNFQKMKIINDLQRDMFEKSQCINDFIYRQEKSFLKVYDEELFVEFLKLSVMDEQYNLSRESLYKLFDTSDERVVMGLVNSLGIFQIDSEGSLEGFDTTSAYPEAVEYISGDYLEITYMILPHPINEEYYLLLLKKLYDENGVFLGWFSYRVPDDDLKDIVKEMSGFGEEGESYLVNSDSFLITPSKFLKSSNKGILTQMVNTPSVEGCLNYSLTGNEYKFGEVSKYLTYNGNQVLGIYSILGKPKWCLLLEVTEDEIARKLMSDVAFKVLGIFGVMIISSLIFGVFINNILIKRV